MNYFSTLQQIRKNIQEINWTRKTSQERAGIQLSRLENDWATLVSKNYEIEEALLKMENDRENLIAGRHPGKQFGF